MEKYFDIDLSGRNSFGIKVKATCLVEYHCVEELNEISRSEELPRPFFHIGGGSNLLFVKDFPGTILHSNIKFTDMSQSGDTVSVRVGAGVKWDDFCQWCALQGLWGAENLSMIPGEVGAAAVQNIGAYGKEVCDIISKVECFDMLELRTVCLDKSDCLYGYRESFFKKAGKGRYVVTAVDFNLSKEYSPAIGYGNVKQWLEDNCGRRLIEEKALSPMLIRQAVMAIRADKLPDVAEIGNAGSYFRNPYVDRAHFEKICDMGFDKVPHFGLDNGLVKIPAAWLIDQCGWKGYKEGNVGVWEKQALIIVNLTGEARAEEVTGLQDKIINSVREKFGIELRTEVEQV